ncbi:MAG: cobalt-precorrin-5B (C(1))-methyltransferase CbiD [Lachnospiraceae bacterium]|nr:cobalt-precorrin-5B (C(1))-methyltransferase CbiD [Lachnospiraceae bacterium]
MQETGLEEYYVLKNHKKLRYGYTTGSCAAAASKAAALMLLSGKQISRIDLMTPKGILLHLEILDVCLSQDQVSCAVRKDGGDDPDATDGLLVYASVSRIPGPEIRIDGGMGVGRVTKAGLCQAVGEAAINTVPRQMIKDALMEVKEDFDYAQGFLSVISVPEGEQAAKKTFNPRLGIKGGISILGTSGIVVPMSEAALIASIRAEMKMLKANGQEYLLITPGNYGESFTKNKMTVDLSSSMKCSNYVGETLDMAVELGIKGILFVAHVGKFIKVAGGIMNTHSRHADSRAELMTAFALRAGADLETAKRILDTETTEEALDWMQEKGIQDKAMELAAERIHYYLQHRVDESIQTEAVIFSSQKGFLAQTDGAEEMMRRYFLKET